MINEFNECSTECVTALNKLLQSDYICLNDKHIMRINRFKRWLLELTNTAIKEAEQTETETNN